MYVCMYVYDRYVLLYCIYVYFSGIFTFVCMHLYSLNTNDIDLKFMHLRMRERMTLCMYVCMYVCINVSMYKEYK